MLVSYALPQVIGGNGYLAVYLCGIIMGNSRIPEKRNLMHVFDTVTGIAQMMIFIFFWVFWQSPVNFRLYCSRRR